MCIYFKQKKVDRWAPLCCTVVVEYVIVVNVLDLNSMIVDIYHPHIDTDKNDPEWRWCVILAYMYK